MKTSTKQLPLTIPADEIAAFCRRYHIWELALFGSVLRDDFGPDRMWMCWLSFSRVPILVSLPLPVLNGKCRNSFNVR